MTIRVGEVGKAFRYSTGLDMSANTALTLNFTKPDGTTLQKTKLTVNAVSAPAVALVNDVDLGNVPASTYMEFASVAADFDQAGIWEVCGIYNDATPNEFHGSKVEFTVLATCD